MKAVLIATALLATISAAGCITAQTRKTIVAGNVELASGGITGSFEVRQSPSGIVSSGTGGACLVFSKQADGGAVCRVDAECAPDPELAGASGYCLHRADTLGKTGRCWFRPTGNYCLRSRITPLPLDIRVQLPVDAAGIVQPVAYPLPGWWRVHACLNGTAGACADTANPDKLTSDGPPKRIR